jgi:hypothetical protein
MKHGSDTLYPRAGPSLLSLGGTLPCIRDRDLWVQDRIMVHTPPVTYVPVRGFECTHIISTCGKKVVSKRTGKRLKVVRGGRVLLYDIDGVARWHRLDELRSASAQYCTSLTTSTSRSRWAGMAAQVGATLANGHTRAVAVAVVLALASAASTRALGIAPPGNMSVLPIIGRVMRVGVQAWSGAAGWGTSAMSGGSAAFGAKARAGASSVFDRGVVMSGNMLRATSGWNWSSSPPPATHVMHRLF